MSLLAWYNDGPVGSHRSKEIREVKIPKMKPAQHTRQADQLLLIRFIIRMHRVFRKMQASSSVAELSKGASEYSNAFKSLANQAKCSAFGLDALSSSLVWNSLAELWQSTAAFQQRVRSQQVQHMLLSFCRNAVAALSTFDNQETSYLRDSAKDESLLKRYILLGDSQNALRVLDNYHTKGISENDAIILSHIRTFLAGDPAGRAGKPSLLVQQKTNEKSDIKVCYLLISGNYVSPGDVLGSTNSFATTNFSDPRRQKAFQKNLEAMNSQRSAITKNYIIYVLLLAIQTLSFNSGNTLDALRSLAGFLETDAICMKFLSFLLHILSHVSRMSQGHLNRPASGRSSDQHDNMYDITASFIENLPSFITTQKFDSCAPPLENAASLGAPQMNLWSLLYTHFIDTIWRFASIHISDKGSALSRIVTVRNTATRAYYWSLSGCVEADSIADQAPLATRKRVSFGWGKVGTNNAVRCSDELIFETFIQGIDNQSAHPQHVRIPLVSSRLLSAAMSYIESDTYHRRKGSTDNVTAPVESQNADLAVRILTAHIANALQMAEQSGMVDNYLRYIHPCLDIIVTRKLPTNEPYKHIAEFCQRVKNITDTLKWYHLAGCTSAKDTVIDSIINRVLEELSVFPQGGADRLKDHRTAEPMQQLQQIETQISMIEGIIVADKTRMNPANYAVINRLCFARDMIHFHQCCHTLKSLGPKDDVQQNKNISTAIGAHTEQSRLASKDLFATASNLAVNSCVFADTTVSCITTAVCTSHGKHAESRDIANMLCGLRRGLLHYEVTDSGQSDAIDYCQFHLLNNLADTYIHGCLESEQRGDRQAYEAQSEGIACMPPQ